MTALSADKQRKHKEPYLQSLDVALTTTIYKGSIVMVVEGTGYAVPGADTASGKTMGVCTEGVDNSAGADGDKTVQVRYGKVHSFTASGADITWMGKNVYIVDDTTVALVGTTTNDVLVGKVMEVISTTEVSVLVVNMLEERTVARAGLIEDALQSYDLLSLGRGDDGVLWIASETAGTHNVALGTNTLTIDAEVANNETETSVSYMHFTLPPEYVAGATATINGKIIAQGAGTLGASTIDFEVFLSTGEEAVGADICATTAVSLVDDVWTAFAFTITPATLTPAGAIVIKMTTVVIESGSQDMIATIDGLVIKLDVKG